MVFIQEIIILDILFFILYTFISFFSLLSAAWAGSSPKGKSKRWRWKDELSSVCPMFTALTLKQKPGEITVITMWHVSTHSWCSWWFDVFVNPFLRWLQAKCDLKVCRSVDGTWLVGWNVTLLTLFWPNPYSRTGLTWSTMEPIKVQSDGGLNVTLTIRLLMHGKVRTPPQIQTHREH